MQTNSAVNLYAALGCYLPYFKNTLSTSHTKSAPGRKHDTDISDRNVKENRPVGALARKVQTKTLTCES